MMGKGQISRRVRDLVDRGVDIRLPHTVEMGDEVDPERIAPDVVIHPGCRIHGADTALGPGSELGREAPVTLEHVQTGRGVQLRGGYASGATFLDGASMGSGAHIRGGTLLEEEASGAHTVGLKQTILLPFVTLGSLINFCDCLMAGGTSRKVHSEVGSSYIHFNFTPHQDKATPSLVGDVPRGVMLDQAPIFLGGQGGLVGPCRIGYGNVVPAGNICRKDALDEGHIVFCDPAGGEGRLPYDPITYKDMNRIVINNLIFLGNLRALQQWYAHARGERVSTDPYACACYEGAKVRISEAVEERILRLGQLADKLPESMKRLEARKDPDMARALASQKFFHEAWPHVRDALELEPNESLGAEDRDAFLRVLSDQPAGVPWVKTVARLPAEARQLGTSWLQAIVDSISRLWHPSAADG